MFGLGLLQAALEKSQGQVLKLERELYQKIEPQTARKMDGPTMPSGEFTTPVASRQGQGDENHTDDTVILYSNSLASRSKVEQLKLQVGIGNSEDNDWEMRLLSTVANIQRFQASLLELLRWGVIWNAGKSWSMLTLVRSRNNCERLLVLEHLRGFEIIYSGG